EQEARDEGLPEEQVAEAAQAAEDAAYADHATDDADTTGERTIVPDPSNDEAATEDAGEAAAQAEHPDTAAEALTPRQLDGEKYPLNPQQQTIADRVVALGKNILVRAKAGTGKTSTLEAIARRFGESDPKKRILYVCFNKTVQVEADGRMPGNVESRTGHSLAYQWVGREFTDAKMGGPGKKPTNTVLRKDTEVAARLGITADMPTNDQGTVLTPRRQAALALKAVAQFANSADDELGYEHFRDADGNDLLANLPDRERVRMLGYAKKAWADIRSKDGQIKTSFDHIRKMWALSKPDLSKTGAGNKKAADVIFLDEAQDTPPVLAKVIADNIAGGMQAVIVGDSDQQIYSFTGAQNYLEKVGFGEENDLPLDTSYRFGKTIADVANRFLQVLGSRERVVGGGSEDGTLREHMGDPQAILTRSNAGMIGEILGEQMNGRTVGVAPGTKKDLQLFIDTARYLKGEGNAPSVMHEDLASFENWAQVEEAIAEDGDPKLVMLEKLIDQYGLDGLEGILDRVVEVDKDGLAGDSETVAGTGLLAKVNAVRDGGRLTLTGGTYPLNEALKTDTGATLGQFGFRWDKDAKAWILTGTPDEQNAALDRLRSQFGVSAGAAGKPDVMVITAHKSKGLEWDRVKIGDDFPQPKEDEATGETTYPDDENLRLAYVAVTRAGKELDPGSLAWVFHHSDENGGKPGAKRAEKPAAAEKPAGQDAPAIDLEADQSEPTVTVPPADLDADNIDVPEPVNAPEGDRNDSGDSAGGSDDPDDEAIADDPNLPEEERDRRREERKRRRKRRNPFNNIPNNDDNSGGMGGLAGAPVGVPLGDLPLNGDADGSGSGAGDDGNHSGSGDVRTPDGRSLGDLSYEDLAAEMNRTLQETRAALAAGDTADVDRLGNYADAVHAAWMQRNENQPTGPNGGKITIAAALRAGDSIHFDGQLWDVDSNTESSGKQRRLALIPSHGGGLPVARLVVWPAGREVELEAEPGAEVPPVGGVAAGDAGAPIDRESDEMRRWVSENWNDGNPHRLPALGRVPVSGGLADELGFYLENGATDGIDQGYTLAPNRKFITVHDKGRALSALDAIADIKHDQARDGNRGALSMAKAAEARIGMVRNLPDAQPTDGTSADAPEAPVAAATAQTVDPTDLRVGDRIEGVLGSTRDLGTLTVEAVHPDGAMLTVTGRNDAGQRDTVKVPSHGTVPLIGRLDGEGEPAWQRDAATSTGADETGALSTDDLRHGDVIVGKAGGRTGRWQLVRPLPNNNPLFDSWSVVPEGQPDAAPERINLSKRRPVQVVSRGDGLPEPVDANGFAEGELRPGDTPATDADLAHLGLSATDAPQAPEAPAAADAAAEVEDTDLRPVPLVNGHLPNPLGMTLPADVTGDYSPEQIEFLSQYAPGQVVANIDGQWRPGDFEGVSDGNYLFRPATSQRQEDVLEVAPEALGEVRGIAAAEGLAEEVAPETL
ncbi:MAG TPA: UvrD-helicase domain-containing protein, partial [Phytomonospora sp.]